MQYLICRVDVDVFRLESLADPLDVPLIYCGQQAGPRLRVAVRTVRALDSLEWWCRSLLERVATETGEL